VVVTRDDPLGSDPADYDRLGRLLADGGGFGESVVAGGGPTSFRPPGYPVWLGSVYAATGDSITAARILQAVLGGVAVVLLGLLARRLWGSRVAVVVAVLAAVHPQLLVASTALLSEAIFVPVELVALWTVVRFRDTGRTGWLVAAGLSSGVVILVRPVGAVVLLAVVLLAGRLRAAALAVAAALLVVVPWLVRDYQAFDMFVPVSTLDGFNLAGTYNDTAANDPPSTRYAFRPSNLVPDHVPIIEANAGDELGMARDLRRQALEHIRDHPTAPVEAMARNSLRLAGLAGFEITATSMRVDAGYGRSVAWAVHLALFPTVAAAGAGAYLARREPLARLLAMVPAGLWLLTVPVLGHARLRGAIEPLLVLFAGLAVVRAADRVGRARSSRSCSPPR